MPSPKRNSGSAVSKLSVERVEADQLYQVVRACLGLQVIVESSAAVAGQPGCAGVVSLDREQVARAAEPPGVAGGHDLSPFRLAEGQNPLRFPGDFRAENSDVN